jgi:hypothetical protein
MGRPRLRQPSRSTFKNASSIVKFGVRRAAVVRAAIDRFCPPRVHAIRSSLPLSQQFKSGVVGHLAAVGHAPSCPLAVVKGGADHVPFTGHGGCKAIPNLEIYGVERAARVPSARVSWPYSQCRARRGHFVNVLLPPGSLMPQWGAYASHLDSGATCDDDLRRRNHGHGRDGELRAPVA